MAKTKGYLLKISPNRREEFEDSIEFEGWFADPVEEFSYSRRLPLITFIIESRNQITHIARGRRGVKAGSGLRRLNCNDIVELDKPITKNKLLKLVSSRTAHWIEAVWEDGGVLPPVSFQNFVDAFLEIAPETKDILERFGKDQRQRIGRLTANERSSLAYQKEAVATALEIAGIDRTTLQNWTLKSDEPISFLDGLDEVKMREDPMVVNDLNVLPGHELIKTMKYGAAVFEGNGSRLTVILANRQPLETQTGTDLIYYNETFGAFVMVQYKAMEREGNINVYRFPNKQLSEEIDRMNLVLAELAKCKADESRKAYRLNENPFLLKFCSRLQFNPNDKGLVSGMYLPLDYWKRCENDPEFLGPRQGKKLTYENVARYLTNDSFVSMVAGGWIGTSITQSSVMRPAIFETLKSGKALTIAIERDDRDPPDDDGIPIMNPLDDGIALDIEKDIEPPLTVKA